MEIKYKFIDHEMNNSAPFTGAMICAIGCKIKCKGCWNRHLKKLRNQKMDSVEIITEVLLHPMNQGIILGGLEWSEQPLELLELCKEASTNGLEIMIYTGLSLTDFQAEIGKACAEKVGMTELVSNDDMYLNAIVGASMLDYYIQGDYYIKCGEYDKDDLVDNLFVYDVKLASANQRVYKILKEEDENED